MGNPLQNQLEIRIEPAENSCKSSRTERCFLEGFS